MAAKQISAVDIARLWYCDPITTPVTGASLATLLKGEEAKEILNIHQDTWSIEESEASQDSYRNQLTGQIYRFGKKQMGDLVVSFTLGQYDYALKAEFLGGKATETSWERARGAVDIKKCLIALTTDDQYCVIPFANIAANEANSDKAVGIAVKGTAMEPKESDVSSEYWFDSSVVAQAG